MHPWLVVSTLCLQFLYWHVGSMMGSLFVVLLFCVCVLDWDLFEFCMVNVCCFFIFFHDFILSLVVATLEIYFLFVVEAVVSIWFLELQPTSFPVKLLPVIFLMCLVFILLVCHYISQCSTSFITCCIFKASVGKCSQPECLFTATLWVPVYCPVFLFWLLFSLLLTIIMKVWFISL